ncbi:uncharacterized protein FA14DRAFT_161860 [Meira miltonrushii]|uniref:Uncharacterized protein n=1 Tax=Meira miltonrushii TaxID=1280837 RepID=A0A316VA89_9BASI|nr:uncharacterized protein FA14DRAFT_161860 [Meira miltonrushii]PWN32415.1 hypothetical protein FA14DRAFT_161860 [Meira miltonrushii]
MQTSDEGKVERMNEIPNSTSFLQSTQTDDEQSDKLDQSTNVASQTHIPEETSTTIEDIDSQNQANLDAASQSAKDDAEEIIKIPNTIPPSNEVVAAINVDEKSDSGPGKTDSKDTTGSSENVADDQETGKDDKETHDEIMQVDVREGSTDIPAEPIAEKDSKEVEKVEKSTDAEVDQQMLDGTTTMHDEAEIATTSNKDASTLGEAAATEGEMITSTEKSLDDGQSEQANDNFATVVPKDETIDAKEGEVPSPQHQHAEEEVQELSPAAADDAYTENALPENDKKNLNSDSIVEKTVDDQQTEKTASQIDIPEVQTEPSDESAKVAGDADSISSQQQSQAAATEPSDEGKGIMKGVGSATIQQQSQSAATEPSEVEATESALPANPPNSEPAASQADENATIVDSKAEAESDDALKIANHDVQSAANNADAAQSEDASQDPTAVTQIAILLKINKELIRLCIDLQGKEQTNDPIYKESAMRLQANLAFLAAMAEPSSSKGSKQTNAMLNDEPFPITSMTSGTLLPKLYAHLRSISTEPKDSSKEAEQSREPPTQDANVSEDVMQKSSDQSSSSSSPNTAGSKKRRRTSTSEQDAQSNRTAPGRSASSNGTKPTNRRKSSTSANAIATSAASTPTLAMPQAVPAASSAAATDMAAHSPNLPLPNGSATGSNGSPAQGPSTISPQSHGARNGNPTPQQLQGLIQAFGQNAVNNLNALQSHYRSGQPQAVVAYMESNVPNFRNLPLQLQLQQMASVQNAAIQRQRQASIGSTISNNAASPGAPGTPQQQQSGPSHQRRPSAAAAPSPGGDQLRRSTQSPMSAPNVPPFSQQATVNGIGQQQQQAPGTPVNMSMPFGNVASPATSAASPGTFGQNQSMQQFQQQQSGGGMNSQMGGSIQRGNPGASQQQPNFNIPAQQQQQPNVPATSQAQQMFASLPPQLSSLPAHLQQQLLQNLMMQQQHQQPAQMTSQPMAPPAGMNPMMAAMFGQAQHQQQSSPSGNFRPGNVGLSGNAGQANGMPNLANMWANMQQQQQQNNTQ